VLEEERPDWRWLIMGPARSGSAFHVDPTQVPTCETCASETRKRRGKGRAVCPRRPVRTLAHALGATRSISSREVTQTDTDTTPVCKRARVRRPFCVLAPTRLLDCAEWSTKRVVARGVAWAGVLSAGGSVAAAVTRWHAHGWARVPL